MFAVKPSRLAVAALLLLAVPALAAEKYFDPSSRKAAVHPYDEAPIAPLPPDVGGEEKFVVDPSPSRPDRMASASKQDAGKQDKTKLAATTKTQETVSHGGLMDGLVQPAAPTMMGGACEALPFWAHMTAVQIEITNLEALQGDVPFAVEQNSAGAPFGPVGMGTSDWATGYGIGYVRALTTCSSVSLNVQSYFSHNLDAQEPVHNNNDLRSLILNPATGYAENTTGRIDFSRDVDYRVLDLAYRQILWGGCNYALNYTTGLRYGKLNQEFQQFGFFTAPAQQSIDIWHNTQVTFEGVGWRGGLDAERRIGATRFATYGKGFVNVLFGNVRGKYEQIDSTNEIVQVDGTWRDNRVVTVLEYELGFNWTSCNNRWKFNLGYYAAFWFNAVSTGEYINAVNHSDYVNLGQTVAFDGLVSRLEYRF